MSEVALKSTVFVTDGSTFGNRHCYVYGQYWYISGWNSVMKVNKDTFKTVNIWVQPDYQLDSHKYVKTFYPDRVHPDNLWVRTASKYLVEDIFYKIDLNTMETIYSVTIARIDAFDFGMGWQWSHTLDDIYNIVFDPYDEKLKKVYKSDWSVATELSIPNSSETSSFVTGDYIISLRSIPGSSRVAYRRLLNDLSFVDLVAYTNLLSDGIKAATKRVECDGTYLYFLAVRGSGTSTPWPNTHLFRLDPTTFTFDMQLDFGQVWSYQDSIQTAIDPINNKMYLWRERGGFRIDLATMMVDISGITVYDEGNLAVGGQHVYEVTKDIPGGRRLSLDLVHDIGVGQEGYWLSPAIGVVGIGSYYLNPEENAIADGGWSNRQVYIQLCKSYIDSGWWVLALNKNSLLLRDVDNRVRRPLAAYYSFDFAPNNMLLDKDYLWLSGMGSAIAETAAIKKLEPFTLETKGYLESKLSGGLGPEFFDMAMDTTHIFVKFYEYIGDDSGYYGIAKIDKASLVVEKIWRVPNYGEEIYTIRQHGDYIYTILTDYYTAGPYHNDWIVKIDKANMGLHSHYETEYPSYDFVRFGADRWDISPDGKYIVYAIGWHGSYSWPTLVKVDAGTMTKVDEHLFEDPQPVSSDAPSWLDDWFVSTVKFIFTKPRVIITMHGDNYAIEVNIDAWQVVGYYEVLPASYGKSIVSPAYDSFWWHAWDYKIPYYKHGTLVVGLVDGGNVADLGKIALYDKYERMGNIDVRQLAWRAR